MSALGDLLLEDGIVDADTLAEALAEEHRTGRPAGLVLLETGAVDEHTYARYLARSLSVPFVDTDEIEAAGEPQAALLSAGTAAAMAIVPVRTEGGTLVLATADPDNLGRFSAVAREVVRPVVVGVGTRSDIAAALLRLYGIEGTTLWVDPEAVRAAMRASAAPAGPPTAADEVATLKTPHPGAVPPHPDEQPITEPVWHDEAPPDAPTVGLSVDPAELARPGRIEAVLDTLDSVDAVRPAGAAAAGPEDPRMRTGRAPRTVRGFIPPSGLKLAPPAPRSEPEDDTEVDRRPPVPDAPVAPGEEKALAAFALESTAEQSPSPVKVRLDPPRRGPAQPAPSRPPPGAPGARFEDRYQLVDRLGIGGMAEVWRARVLGAKGFRRMVVVKKILPEYTTNRDFVDMFIDEANIACRLSHPNIAQIYELVEDRGELYIVMEYVDGPDLATIFEQASGPGPRLSAAVAAHIIEQICDGLEYAHRATDDRGRPLNLIHRDITPHNVLVSYEGHVKIIDFGIAKAAEKVSVTRVGYMKGKPGYIAPEQALGMPIDQRLDVFAAGIILYELLTHERLFKDTADAAELRKLATFDARPLLKWKLKIPGALRAAAIKALAVRREERFASARDLAGTLRSFMRKRRDEPRDELVPYLRMHLPPVGGWGGPTDL